LACRRVPFQTPARDSLLKRADSSNVVIVHLDESCLGNGRSGPNPGGAGGLLELRRAGEVDRFDLYLHHQDTTNNRMAIQGAIATLQLLARKGNMMQVLIVSDSQYLVKGMREWVPGWRARGWRRKAGPIENLELWQELVAASERHRVQWTWVRGHEGHVKNEFANDIAVRAAQQQISSEGAVASEFSLWLAGQQTRGRYQDFDPDADFGELESMVLAAKPVPLNRNTAGSPK